MKCCKKCGELKPPSEFYKHISTRDRLRAECKSCSSLACAKRAAVNPEVARARAADWYAKNHDRALKSRAQWAAKNKDRVRASKSKWRAANPEKMQACRDKWATENPERARNQQRINNRNRKSRLATGRLSAGIIAKLLLLQRGKCACCGKPLGNKYHLDHIMPLALGGTNTDDNIQLLRQECNQQKSAKHPVDFMQQKGFLI